MSRKIGSVEKTTDRKRKRNLTDTHHGVAIKTTEEKIKITKALIQGYKSISVHK